MIRCVLKCNINSWIVRILNYFLYCKIFRRLRHGCIKSGTIAQHEKEGLGQGILLLVLRDACQESDATSSVATLHRGEGGC